MGENIEKKEKCELTCKRLPRTFLHFDTFLPYNWRLDMRERKYTKINTSILSLDKAHTASSNEKLDYIDVADAESLTETLTKMPESLNDFKTSPSTACR